MTWDFNSADSSPSTAMQTTRGGIDGGIHYVMRGGISTPDTDCMDDFTPQSVNASYVALVKWANASLFVVYMLGEHGRLGGQIRRYNPEQHHAIQHLYCVGCKRLGNYGRMSIDPRTNATQFEGVAYACTFGAFLYDIKEDEDILNPVTLVQDESQRYVERTRRNIGQSISTAGQFEYDSPNAWPTRNDVIPTPPALMCPYSEFTYTWRYVPGPITDLEDRCDALYGKVNNAIFDGKAIGTCMYLGMEPEPIIASPASDITGSIALPVGPDRLYTIKHKVGFFRLGWNSVYRPNLGLGDGAWDQARNRATGGPPYTLATFSTMFTV